MKLTVEQVREFRSMFKDELRLYSTFTHLEGLSELSSKYREIITEYVMGGLILKLRTYQDDKDSEEVNEFQILRVEDYDKG